MSSSSSTSSRSSTSSLSHSSLDNDPFYSDSHIPDWFDAADIPDWFDAADPPSSLPIRPLSLQDICMLHVLLRVDEFPAESLALLPRAIRRYLFFCLPFADVLHFSETALFSDIEELDLEGCQNSSREDLVYTILHGKPTGMICCCLQHYTQDWSNDLDFFEFICETESFKSLGASLIMDGQLSGVVVPKHLKQFLEIKNAVSSDNVNIDSISLLAWSFLHYCNVHCAPYELKIDCDTFNHSVWCNKNDKQLVVPFIQEFLSEVEVLDLGTSDSVFGVTLMSVAAPYVPLYNIVTSNEPRLRHLKLSGNLIAIEIFLLAIAEVICTTKCESCSDQHHAPLTIDPYPALESLTLNIQPNSCRETSSMKHCIPCIMRSIVEMKTLRYVEVDDQTFTISHCYDRVLFSLTHLLKQPQFESLEVHRSSFPAECELIKTFLTTPTTHEQTLFFGDIHKEKKKSPKMKKRKKRGIKGPPKKAMKLATPSTISYPSQPLPETNTQYKCLGLGMCCSDIHFWLLNLPELKLKKLTIATEYVALVHEDITIQVEHVVFYTQVRHSDNMQMIESVHLEKFVVSNTALRRLEFFYQVDKFIFPALNHCLSLLCQQGRGPEKIIVKSFQFDRIDHIRDFFVRLEDLSHSYGTTLVLSAYTENEVAADSSLEQVTSMLDNFRKVPCQCKKEIKN